MKKIKIVIMLIQRIIKLWNIIIYMFLILILNRFILKINMKQNDIMDYCLGE